MKLKTTNKAIKANYAKVYRVGYCAMYYLLKYEEPRAYTSGVYGWNADLYEVDGVAIVTGYRPGVGESVNYEIVDKYEKKAQKIFHDYAIPYETRKKKITKLLHKCIEELTKE